MTKTIPIPSKKTSMYSIGTAGIVYILTSQPITPLSLAGTAIVAIVTMYCVHTQYLIDIKKVK